MVAYSILGMKVVPPNFGYVEDGIFRCGLPEPRHFGFIASLRLRTCIQLTDAPDPLFSQWLMENGVQVLCPLAISPRSTAVHRPLPNIAMPAKSHSSFGYGYSEDMTGRRGGTWGQGSNALSATGGSESGGEGAHAGIGLGAPSSIDSSITPALTTSGASGGPMLSTGGSASPPGQNAGRGRKPLSAGTRDDAEGAVGNAGPQKLLVPTPHRDDPWSIPYNALLLPGTAEANSQGLMTLSEPVVVRLLSILLDPVCYPLLITCSRGRYRTGIVCGCLRKLQRWNLVSILEEYRRYAGDKSRAENEEFIELFDIDLVSSTVRSGLTPTILYRTNSA